MSEQEEQEGPIDQVDQPINEVPTEEHDVAKVKVKAKAGEKRRRSEDSYDKLTTEEEEQAAKFQRGEKVNYRRIKDKKLRGKLRKTEYIAKKAVTEAVKAQVLLTEEAGYLEPEGMEETHNFSQQDLVPHVDLQTASKMFDLSLDQLGPYKVDYSPNGKYLLLCGRRGHVAMIDWVTKQLKTELYLNETCRDVKFLHDQTFFAVAQKRYTYIYDASGTEIHRLEKMNAPTVLDFLPHHFLLVSVNEGGVLRYQDTSTGQFVSGAYTKQGPCHVMRQNPWNAIMNLGHAKGCVTMWAPNTDDCLVKIQCHAAPVTSLAVDASGKYLVTTGRDNRLKIWDIRTYKELYSYYTPIPGATVDISQRGVVSVGCGNIVEMWKNCFNEEQTKPYMRHRMNGNVAEKVRFCPYEDFLGVGHSNGFSSIVVPGSGEPNFDSFAANPYQTTKQRRETEVKALLDKIQPDMIVLDPTQIGHLKKNADKKKDNPFQPESETPKGKEKNKMRGKNTSSKRANLKQHDHEVKNRELKREQIEKEKAAKKKDIIPSKNIPRALSRFK